MNIIENFDLFLFDMDGVIYIGNKPIPGSVELINHLYNRNKIVIFLTNNPARSDSEYAKKLNKTGIKTNTDHIITSTKNICHYLKNHIKELNKKSAYVIGSRHFKSSIHKTGINIVRSGNNFKSDYVIMGGHRNFNFNEIDNASQFIRNGARIIASNRDSHYPSELGVSPGTGALLSSIEITSGKKAIITGKPEKHIFQLSLKLAGIKNKKKVVIIGDNLQTDILGGNNFGISTILSLTGVTSKKDLKNSEIKPDYIIKNPSELINLSH
ncbi:MAG: TIGR01459 family HAD-type hydrolase [Thermodesulfobacteriota bacterium]